MQNLSQVSLQNKELLQLQKISDNFLNYHQSVIQEKIDHNNHTKPVFQLSKREEFSSKQKEKILAKNRKKITTFIPVKIVVLNTVEFAMLPTEEEEWVTAHFI